VGGRVNSSDLTACGVGAKNPCKPSLVRIDKLSLDPVYREFFNAFFVQAMKPFRFEHEY
jgi:hypothetical protein